MPETTDRHAFPLLVPGQGQKDITHNEALAAMDAVLHPAVESLGESAVPAAPALGQSWVVSAGASGEWSGRQGQLAVWTSGGWRFSMPVEGMVLMHRASGQLYRLWEGAYRPVLPLVAPPAAIAPPAGGMVVDVEARLAVADILARLETLGLLA
jgi:hypothetical protein